MAIRRLKKELKDLESEPHKQFSAGPVGDDIFAWSATINGTLKTPYEGGTFLIDIKLPQDYPYREPKMKLRTKIFHCNLSGDPDYNCLCCGTNCIEELKDSWSPALTVKKILSLICDLLDNPDPERKQGTGGNTSNEARKLFQQDKEAYNEKAREWTQRYAQMKEK